jgi:glycosyltransferase involved in cell wall biosynthesis
VARGARAISRAVRAIDAHAVHVRSYVPALMAMNARPAHDRRLLFDIRGFWADERIEGGIWPQSGWLYRLAKRWERRFFERADAIVTLTQASVPQIRAWVGERDVPIEVIPTCVDPSPFLSSARHPDGPRLVWSGSIGTWYRLDIAQRLAEVSGMPFIVLTRQVDAAKEALNGGAAEIRTVPGGRMAEALHAGDIGLCLYVDTFSRAATAPTRAAEFLAAGMPVAVTPGVGDLVALAAGNAVGVEIAEDDDASLADAAERLKTLAADDSAVARCRELACRHFDVHTGVQRYAALYRDLAVAGVR